MSNVPTTSGPETPCCHCTRHHRSIETEGTPGTPDYGYKADCVCGARIIRYVTSAKVLVTLITQKSEIIDRKEVQL
jgi:hypothetical protein